MESSDSIVISNESEAFAWLQKALSGNLGENLVAVSFRGWPVVEIDRKSTRLNSSHGSISDAVFCLKKKMDC